jgi:hypothetical protein
MTENPGPSLELELNVLGLAVNVFQTHCLVLVGEQFLFSLLFIVQMFHCIHLNQNNL